MPRLSLAPPAVFALAVLLACSQDINLGPAAPRIPDGQLLTVNATVAFNSLNGGCWALVTANGHYGPVNLPSAFQVKGLKVRAILRDAPGAGSICEPFPLVYVDSISRR